MTDTFSNGYPHAELTKLTLDAPPSYASLKLLHKEINANAMSVPSLRGGGQHGHLALVINAARYLILTGAAFVTPPPPGPQPVHPLGLTQPQITAANRAYDASVKDFTGYTVTGRDLKKQLLEAIPDIYTDELADETLGYANTDALAIMTHLDTTYGAITADDLDKNIQDLNRQWDPSMPLEDLWKQVRISQQLAQGTDPISDATAVRAILTNLEQSGVFGEAISDWRKLPAAGRTLPGIKTHFNTANKERVRKLTTQAAGYNSAAQAVAAQAVAEPVPTAPTILSGKSLFYCWSHGLGPNSRHTSATCRAKAPNHNPLATAANMLGGCDRIHRKRDEAVIWVPTGNNYNE